MTNGKYLVFLIQWLLGIRYGSPQVLNGNCDFDHNSLCNWRNEKILDHFDWQVRKGPTPSINTGPTNDNSGNGSYIHIETSRPRKYNERAWLLSPWMRGVKRMTFFYSMYGDTIESLSVFVRVNASESRVWSRHGNLKTSNWTKGCIVFNYSGNYQVIIEGTAGLSYTGDIAVDDISFTNNLSCGSGMKFFYPQMFGANCSFNESFCGWRKVSWDSQFDWSMRKTGTPNNGTGPRSDHTGGGNYIYIEASFPRSPNDKALLLSPLLQGPKCLHFFYHMYGSHIGTLDVSLYPHEVPEIDRNNGLFLIWSISGGQGNKWMKASVDMVHNGEFQVVLTAIVGRSYQGDIAVDDISFTDGLCDGGNDTDLIRSGSCSFDKHWCYWKLSANFSFKWTRRYGKTPSVDTGPSRDHTTGNGRYIYIETSAPRKAGDTARLVSPLMRGPQCMTFYYHMYGDTMSCIVIYIKSQDSNKLKPVWLKSENRGDLWIRGQISINESSVYQIIVDGVRGINYRGDAALDDFSFQKGTCNQTGTRRLEVTFLDNKTSLPAFVGSELLVSGFYKFCCDGVYCPDCPMELNISTLQQNVTVTPALNMSCTNTPFTAPFTTEKQPGNFTIKITYAFANNSEQRVNGRVLGHVLLQAVVVNKCSFQSGFCDWKNIADMDHKWKLSTGLHTLMNYTGYFAYIDGAYKAQLKSPLLQWKPFHRTVGLCLRFKYLMQTHSKSTLRIFLKEAKQEKPVLEWQLSGYQGGYWSVAQVVWSGADATQIIFEGEGFLAQKLNIAIDFITVTTENCSLRPYFAKPDFKCSDNQFRCTNGECVKNNLLCDGDYACKDGSDEKNCACPTNMFQCKGGGCLRATALCDETKEDGCDGEDEINCRNPCSDYQCLDGSCIPWKSTCSKTSFCRDKTNTPSICGSGKCHLNDLACSSKTSRGNKSCRSFRGHCNFQNGLCGLRTDKFNAIQWTVASGQTPTESTGPSHDHTSFNKKGSYIYIEASQRQPGERARLLSSWMEPNETICLQFWYHMHGSDIGNLSVYLKTNQSERLVWRLTGENGNRWRFGQTALNSPNYYKFVLEGTVGGGSKGDVAVDDLMVLDGNCETILKQGSPDCHFEESMCDWAAEEGWVLDPILVGLEKRGGYILLAGVTATLSSPIINTHDYEWKCFRFWYLISSMDVHHFDVHFLTVIIRSVTSNQTMRLFFDDKVTNEGHYVQIPIPSNYSNAQIDFVAGKNSRSSLDLVIAIDGVSFSKESCEHIPWKPENDRSCGNFDFEKGTLEGWIADGAAFSHQPTFGDNIHARTSGYNKTSSGHQGSWWIGTYENRSKADIPAGEVQGNTPTGYLLSSLIRITGPDANFLFGGGCGSKTVVYLALDGIPHQFYDKIKCKEQMIRVTSRVFKDFEGRVGRIVLFDHDEGGHLNFDVA